MERLTEWCGKHAAVVNNHENYIDRLAAYEDTGLDPREINDLELKIQSLEMSLKVACDALEKFTKAEHEGRLVVLPCKVGDKIYKLCPVSTFLKKGDLWSGRIIERDCDMCEWGCCDCHDIGPQYDDHHKNIVHEMTLTSLSAIVRIIPYWGKFYFLTREEAEKALNGGANQ